MQSLIPVCCHHMQRSRSTSALVGQRLAVAAVVAVMILRSNFVLVASLSSLTPSTPPSASSSSPMTPQEMGRRAETLAQELADQQGRSSMDTLLSHAGMNPSKGQNLPLAPPLHMATTYTRPANGQYLESDSIYTRADNPTRLLLEHEIARLETHGGDSKTNIEDSSGISSSMTAGNGVTVATTEATCTAFASGMMAASSIILAHQAPLHVILPVDLYHGVPTVLMDVFSRFQVTVEHVDLQKPLLLEEAVTNVAATAGSTKDVIVWIETPSNPLNHVIDIAVVCQRVRAASQSSCNVTIVVDSTLAPPTLTQPLKLGADLVVHSATEYLSGHSDALLGVVTTSPWTKRGQELAPRLREVQIAVGGVASPMDCWLTLRGLRTLSLRVQRQCDTAKELAVYLSNHPSVQTVYYPGLNVPGNEQSIIDQQMKGCGGGMLSVNMGSESKAIALAGALRTIQRATSLGGTETLIEHRASIEPANRVTSPVGLLRIAVGLEDASDLINDLRDALTIVDALHS